MAVGSSAAGHALRDVHLVRDALLRQTVRLIPAAILAAAVFLAGVLVIALLCSESPRVPASGPPFAAGGFGDTVRLFGENLLVLALYATGSLAALASKARSRSDAMSISRRRAGAGRAATALVLGLMFFAACRQALVLGRGVAGFAGYFYVSRSSLWLGVLPHAAPEMTAFFLPVSAWRFASRHAGRQTHLVSMAAAVVAALPLLATAAAIETYLSPSVIRAVACIKESEGFSGGGDCGAEAPECPKLSPAEFERRYHIHVSQAAGEAQAHCARPRGG